ncbi:unnamed protein product [Penicillium roqueforti FM164]|uniref:Genomic scaffold, ProqFM164S01 n=1 Tax=Penicillium roqueforti (strain FM164) TaxID=1365484 RepID=W6PXX8_PENRF|nr:unnamed protein product [Penicillium roqueforti FM164]
MVVCWRVVAKRSSFVPVLVGLWGTVYPALVVGFTPARTG